MKKRFFAYIGALFVLASATLAVNGLTSTSNAADIDNSPDCDTVAVIKCGAYFKQAILNKMHGDMPKVFAAFGISRSDISKAHFVNGVVWRDGRVTVDGKTVATGAVTAGRWNNPTPDMHRIPGTNRAYKMSTRHFVNAGQTALVAMKDGIFQFASIKPCGNPVSAKPTHKPKPVYACDNLTADRISRDSFKFTAKAHAKDGAKLVGYHFYFGDGHNNKQSSRTAKHTFKKSGKHTITVKTLVRIGKSTKEVGSKNCEVTVNVKPQPPKPVYLCDSLTASQISRTEFNFTTKATATNGAKITSHSYNFGDGRSAVAGSKVKHSYVNTGSYTVKVTVEIKVDGKTKYVTSQNCQVTIQVPAVPEKPKPPVKVCDLDTMKIVKVSGEKLANNPDRYTTDLSQCEKQPEVIAETGPTGLISSALGLSTLGSAGYYLRDSRKQLLSRLMKR